MSSNLVVGVWILLHKARSTTCRPLSETHAEHTQHSCVLVKLVYISLEDARPAHRCSTH